MIDTLEERAVCEEKIRKVCAELGLSLFSDAAFFAYIETLNREANKLFDIDVDGEDYFKNV